MPYRCFVVIVGRPLLVCCCPPTRCFNESDLVAVDGPFAVLLRINRLSRLPAVLGSRMQPEKESLASSSLSRKVKQMSSSLANWESAKMSGVLGGDEVTSSASSGPVSR